MLFCSIRNCDEMAWNEPTGAVLERILIGEPVWCYECEAESSTLPPGVNEPIRAILQQQVKTSIQPATTVYHCGIGCDACRRFREYVTQQEIRDFLIKK